MIPFNSIEVYKIAERDIANIKKIQDEIRFNLGNSSFSKSLAIVARNIFGHKQYSLLELYNMQLYNVSSLNRVLPEAIRITKGELNNIESKIDGLYSNMGQKSNNLARLEEEIITNRARITNLISKNFNNYEFMMKKSTLERKLTKDRHLFALIKDYLENSPREISLLESQQKLINNCYCRFEYIFQKSKHIEAILSGCLNGIKTLTSKQELMHQLGIAFLNIEEYVSSVTDYTAREIINSTGNILGDSNILDYSLENSIGNLEVINSLEEVD